MVQKTTKEISQITKVEFCINQGVIFQNTEIIWSVLSDWYDWSWFSSVEKIEKIHSDDYLTRSVNGAFIEKLLFTDLEALSMKYSIINGPKDFGDKIVKDFLGTVKLEPLLGGRATLVIWKTQWYSLKPNKLYKSTDIICKQIISDLKIFTENGSK